MNGSEFGLGLSSPCGVVVRCGLGWVRLGSVVWAGLGFIV